MATDDGHTSQPRREGTGSPAESAPPVTGLRLITPLDDEAEGGDPVCWAHLVCEECGAVTTEGHRDWCSHAD